MVDITDAVQIPLAIFIVQILSSRSDYFHGVVWVKKSAWLPGIKRIDMFSDTGLMSTTLDYGYKGYIAPVSFIPD